MNAYVVSRQGPVHVIADIGCVEFRPQCAVVLRGEGGEILDSIVLQSDRWLLFGEAVPDQLPLRVLEAPPPMTARERAARTEGSRSTRAAS